MELSRTSSERRAFSASARLRPTTSGTVTFPEDTCSFTALSLTTELPGAGSEEITASAGTVALLTVLTGPTVRPACWMDSRAYSRDWPTMSSGTFTFSGPSDTLTTTEESRSTSVPAAGDTAITCLSCTVSLCSGVNVGFRPASRRVFSAVVLSMPSTWGTVTRATCSTCWLCHHCTPSTVPAPSRESSRTTTRTTTQPRRPCRRSGTSAPASSSGSKGPGRGDGVGSVSSLRPAAVTAPAATAAPTAGRVLVWESARAAASVGLMGWVAPRSAGRAAPSSRRARRI